MWKWCNSQRSQPKQAQHKCIICLASHLSASSRIGSVRSTSGVAPSVVRPVRSSAWQQDAAQWQELRMKLIMRCQSAAVVETEAPGKPAAPAAAPAAPAAPDVTACDIRVGKIVKVEKHPDADSLYVEQIDVGEPEPRTIVSGLVEFVPIEQMQDRSVIVICNLKPRNMRGIKSNGMVLCASNDTHNVVEPLTPPEGAAPGTRVWFGEGNEAQPAPAEPNRVQKKKIWEGVQPLLKTDDSCVATFKGLPMLTSAGPVVAATLKAASIA